LFSFGAEGELVSADILSARFPSEVKESVGAAEVSQGFDPQVTLRNDGDETLTDQQIAAF